MLGTLSTRLLITYERAEASGPTWTTIDAQSRNIRYFNITSTNTNWHGLAQLQVRHAPAGGKLKSLAFGWIITGVKETLTIDWCGKWGGITASHAILRVSNYQLGID